MTLEQLRYFCVVAQFKNFSRASEYLFISNSALSRSITALEESLGVQLLYRSNRFVELTSVGQYLLERAQPLLVEFDKLQNSVYGFQQNHTSTLLISCIQIYHEPLFEALKCFSDSHPDTKLFLNPQSPWEVNGAVLSQGTELGITHRHEITPDCTELEVYPLFREKLVLVVNKDHPLNSQSAVTIEDIVKEDIVSFSRAPDPSHPFFSRLARLKPSLTRPQSFLTFNSLYGALMQIKIGTNVCILAESYAQEHKEGCAIIPIDDEDAFTDIVLIKRRDSVSRIASEFVECIREFASV